MLFRISIRLGPLLILLLKFRKMHISLLKQIFFLVFIRNLILFIKYLFIFMNKIFLFVNILFLNYVINVLL